MDVLHPKCCGLDVHKNSISACILVQVAGRVQKHQRRFGAMTQDLQELANWLRQFEVAQVAMESSGVYWKPVWNILEGQFTVVLANAQRITAFCSGVYLINCVLSNTRSYCWMNGWRTSDENGRSCHKPWLGGTRYRASIE